MVEIRWYTERKSDIQQRQLVDDFLDKPNNYKEKAVRTSVRIHQDGATERWKIELDNSFFVFVDCSVPSPWSTSQDDDYFSLVILVGYDAGSDNFYLP